MGLTIEERKVAAERAREWPVGWTSWFRADVPFDLAKAGSAFLAALYGYSGERPPLPEALLPYG